MLFDLVVYMMSSLIAGFDAELAMKPSVNGKPLLLSDLDRTVRGLVTVYGVKAVKDSVRRLAQGRSGPSVIDDWTDLLVLLEDDPTAVLNSNAFRVSNWAVAQKIAARKPGQSITSTVRRLLRKLKQDRLGHAQAFAAILAATDEPIRTYELLTKKLSLGTRASEFWRSRYLEAVRTKQAYAAAFNEAAEEVSYAEAKGKLLASQGTASKGFGISSLGSQKTDARRGSDISPHE